MGYFCNRRNILIDRKGIVRLEERRRGALTIVLRILYCREYGWYWFDGFLVPFQLLFFCSDRRTRERKS